MKLNKIYCFCHQQPLFIVLFQQNPQPQKSISWYSLHGLILNILKLHIYCIVILTVTNSQFDIYYTDQQIFRKPQTQKRDPLFLMQTNKFRPSQLIVEIKKFMKSLITHGDHDLNIFFLSRNCYHQSVRNYFK